MQTIILAVVLSALFIAQGVSVKSQLEQYVGLIGKSQNQATEELSQFGDSSRTKQRYLVFRSTFASGTYVKTVPNFENGNLRSISIRLANGDLTFHAVRDSLISTLGQSADSARGWDRTLRIPPKLQHDLGWVDYRSFWLIPRNQDTVAVLLTMLDKHVHLAIGEMRWLFQDATEGFWQTRRDELIPPPPPGRTQFNFDTVWYKR